jgi:phosphoglucomutase
MNPPINTTVQREKKEHQKEMFLTTSTETNQLLQKIQEAFKTLIVAAHYKEKAIAAITKWLTLPEFEPYKGQLRFIIENQKWELLLDSFYQIIPFGTGGRRGPVGIGTNRINPWTIEATAQGHASYLLQKFPNAKVRGVVIAYDGRKYPNTNIYDATQSDPIKRITSQQFAEKAAAVYTANNITVHFFETMRTTPELSFAIRTLGAVAGINISASHNPKEDNGIKVYADDGAQLIPPHDQKLADTINSVKEIKKVENKNLIKIIKNDMNAAYIQAVKKTSLSSERNINILYTPLHGVGSTSVFRSLKEAQFPIWEDEKTKVPDGNFPNVKFNIPNPEWPESFETCYNNPLSNSCDLLFSSDPDADRLGLAVKHNGTWHYLNGQEISILILGVMLKKLQPTLTSEHIAMTTMVTSSLLRKICEEYNIKIIDNLLVGFKYIGDEILKLEKEGKIDKFIVAMEDSHGYLVGTYSRDKDAASAALILAEYAAEIKKQNKTLIDTLNELYKQFGYAENILTCLFMQGAKGHDQILQLQKTLREKRKTNQPTIGKFTITKAVDCWDGTPHLSKTDTMSRNLLVFYMEPNEEDIEMIKVAIRPSGTEPKIKMYIEVIGKPLGTNVTNEALQQEKARLIHLRKEVRKAFLQEMYSILSIEMPERGYELSDLLFVETKVAYFEQEKKILELKRLFDEQKITKEEYKNQLKDLLSIFGQDPIEKIDLCFKQGHGKPFREFLFPFPY